MSFREKDLLAYLHRIHELFEKGAAVENNLSSMEDIHVKEMECLYVFDLSENQVVFHKGFERMFGFEDSIINLPFILNKYHPEDGIIVKAIVKSCLDQILMKSVPAGTELMRIVYRFKDSKGNFRNILSNTVVQSSNKDGLIQSFLIKYTDLDFLTASEVVEWWVNADFLDKDRMLEDVYGDRRRVFTDRELEVIKEMIKGKANVEIASDLNISEHTVSTHRKNIFHKASCNDVVALHKFCKSNGILTF